MAVPAATDEDASAGGTEEDIARLEKAECRTKLSTPIGSLEPRPLRPFKSGEEYLYAMKEDLAEWLQSLYEDLQIDADHFFEALETGVVLCRHANHVLHGAREAPGLRPCWPRVVYRTGVQPGTFQARDNVSQFIGWCRGWLRVKECLLFETDDLVERKNERNVVLCLLEVARRGCDLCEGMPAPLLVQMEREIDAEVARDEAGGRRRNLVPIRRPLRLLDAATMTSAVTLGVIESSDDGGNGGNEADDDDHSEDDAKNQLSAISKPQVITNDLRSLHQRVAALLNLCTCPAQFPMLRVADGKYRIGDTQVLIFVRVLRNHVMVRVGGGWDTLEHYLEKHDPCRGRTGRRLSATGMKGSSYQKGNITQTRPRSCGTPSRSSNVQLTSPSVQRRRSLDFSSRLSSPDDARPPSVGSSRTPSRGSSPRATRAFEEEEWRYRRVVPSRQHQSDCSSSEVSEEGVDHRWGKGRHRQRKSSPKKIMRFGDNDLEESEADSIYSSPPRSMDGCCGRRKDPLPVKSHSLGSDDSAVSLETLARTKTRGTPQSKIPKSQPQRIGGRHSGHLSSSRSETSLFSPHSYSSPTARSNRDRATPSQKKSSNLLPRSGSSTFLPASNQRGRRRSSSATRTIVNPSKEYRPVTRPKSSSVGVTSCSSVSSSCQSSPGKPVTPLLEEILHDSELLDTDEKLLRRMEQLIDEYKLRAPNNDCEDDGTEDTTTACFSLSLDDDEEPSSLNSFMVLPTQQSPNKRTKSSTNLLAAKSPSKIPIFTAWQVKDC